MVKSMLKKMLSDNVEEPPAPVVIDYEPKLTRSKIKEVLEQEKVRRIFFLAFWLQVLIRELFILIATLDTGDNVLPYGLLC